MEQTQYANNGQLVSAVKKRLNVTNKQINEARQVINND